MAEAGHSKVTAKTIFLKEAIKEGMPEAKSFEIKESSLSSEDLQDGQMLVQIMWMAVDPYLRSGPLRQDSSAGKPISGFVSGKVVKSKSDKWAEGAKFGGMMAFSSYQVVTAEGAKMWPLGPLPEEQMSYAIGVLGMPGATAYGGITGVLEVKEGDVVWISAAAGAVGSVAGQMAKALGATVIGTAGSQEKIDWLKTIGFDHALSYKGAKTGDELAARIKAVAPDGIDCYFENVGGIHFEAAMSLLRAGGRVAVCGCITHYNSNMEAGVPKEKFSVGGMIYSQQRIQGFLSTPWLEGKKGNFTGDTSKWLQEKKIEVKETLYEGIENWPKALAAIFEGKSMGKIVVKTY